MLERYLVADGEEYVDVNCVREVLGIVDEHVDVFGVIKKLKEERDGLNADLELTNRLYKENHDFVDKVCEAVDIQRPCTESGYDNAVRLIAGFKRERDELKEKCDKMKKRANAVYGVSCGYSGDKAPTFRCDVISYSKLVNNCIDDLCDKYNVVQPVRSLTTRERLDYIFGALAENRERYNSEWKWVEQLKKEKRTVVDSLAELRAKIREIYRNVVDDECDEYRGYSSISALNDINEEYKRVVHNFEERTADWSNARQELDRYRLAVGSLLDIPKEIRDDINAIERAFTSSKNEYKSLKEFRNDVAKAVCSNPNDSNADILKAVEAVMEHATELQFNTVDKDEYDKQKKLVDRLARLRSNICTALGLGGETSDEEILKRVMEIRESHDKLARLRSNICSEFSLVPENCDGNIIGHIHMMQDCHDELREFRDAVAEAIGIKYPTTNNFILRRVSDIYKERGESHDLAMELDRKCIDLTAKNSDLQQKFEFQSGLRQMWYARYESEHERANGVQKALDREREKCRVKDISLETAKKQYEKVCGNLETAECALNGMKSKIRELRNELNAERHSNLTEDIETHPIDTDPGYLRSGEEENNE